MILVITMIVLTFPTSLFAEEMKTTADSQTATVESTFHQFTGVIFEDTNKNGQKDANEKGYADMEICLFNSDNKSQEADYITLTKADGTFQYPKVKEGSYRLKIQSADAQLDMKDYTIRNPQEDGFVMEEKQKKTYVIKDIHVPQTKTIALSLRKKPKKRIESHTLQTKQTDVPKQLAKKTIKDVTDSNKKKLTAKKEAMDITPVSMSELAYLPLEKTGAARNTDTALMANMRSALSAETWNFQTYYVGQDDAYYVDKSNDFSLKYQMEFHTSVVLEKEAVTIRIPKRLLQDRNGKDILPTSIAVPQGSKEQPIKNKIIPFNYYEEGADLVFFNYDRITAGSNIAFQILYKDVNIMTIRNGSQWSLTPSIQIMTKDGMEEKQLTPLRGSIHSQVQLMDVKKSPLLNEKSYYPGIYTKEQLQELVQGTIDEEFLTRFEAYRFVAWRVDIKGYATQPWDLYIKDQTSHDGKVVGFQHPYEPISYHGEAGYYKIATQNMEKKINYTGPEHAVLVVVAYPKDKVSANEVIENSVEVIAHPCDGGEDQTKESSTSWIYQDYDWNYHGDEIGVLKSGGGNFSSWLEVYKSARKAGQDVGDLPFKVNGINRGYAKTHYLQAADGIQLGDRIPGASYLMTTVDDFLYAYPNTGDVADYQVLDDQDYYYSSVSITQTDIGYDPYEDRETVPEKTKGIVIEAMFAGSHTWEKVKEIPWESSGRMRYYFTKEELKRKPWRVKVVHESVNYESDCMIELQVRLRHDSPVLAKLVKDNDDVQEITLENIAGIMGQKMAYGVPQEYYHSQSIENGNYREPGLIEATKALYDGILITRASAKATLTSLQKHAASYKYGQAWNDTTSGRVHLKYNIMAFDGYEVYDAKGVSFLKEYGVTSPGRKEVVFYDLLPYGIKFDPSIQIRAGRVPSTSSEAVKQEKVWDQEQVKVVVDSQKDIDTNYRGSGRTRIAFHIQYEGEDASGYYDKMWMEGWGVSFGAYYDWKDADISNAATNIAAFMPAKTDDEALLGTDNEVMPDDGRTYPSDEDKQRYQIFGEDIDGDGNQKEQTVLYANASVNEDIVMASMSKLEKLVRSDDDRFGSFDTEATVLCNHGYTYEISVKNATKTLSDIVVFDRLEDAPLYQADTHFENNWWYGSFTGINVNELKEKGVAPIVYYNANRNAKITTEDETPDEVLTVEHGWIRSEDWKRELSEVKAIAVDMRKDREGNPFTIKEMGAVSFQIHMQSPKEDESLDTANHENTHDKKHPATYAYNDASFYSKVVEDQSEGTVNGNAVRVKQHQPETLEVIKTLQGKIPEKSKDMSFRFQASYAQKPFATQEYQLYKKTGDGWTACGTNRVYATEADGSFYLHADEKAVFHLLDQSLMEVKEEENPFWKVDITDVKHEDTRTMTFQNTYRPVLYAQKKVQGYPDKMDIAKETFHFQIKADDQPLANAEYWVVDSIRNDGGIPMKLKEGKTDANGQFEIKANEIIALFPGDEGMRYEVNEIYPGKDWFCEQTSVSGIMKTFGNVATITNHYKWKELYLTKEVKHQNAEECKKEFTFEVASDDHLLTGARWVILNEDGSESDVEGILDENGRFSAACAGKIIKIEGFTAGKSYKVKEIDDTGYTDGDYYEPINATVEGMMPCYAKKAEATIVNDYLLRPLQITKLVSFDPSKVSESEQQAIETREFTMQILIEGKPYADKEYRIMKNGMPVGQGKTSNDGYFSIQHQQTIVFQDVGVEGMEYTIIETPDADYEQIYPVDKTPAIGKLAENSTVTFVNGDANTFMIGKEYVVGVEDNGRGNAYLEDIRQNAEIRDKEKVHLKLEIQEHNGEWAVWPKETTEVQVLDTIHQTQATLLWEAGKEIQIEPWKRIMINTLPKDTRYRLSESSKDRYKLYKQDGGFIEITPKIGELANVIQQQPLAILQNQISGRDQMSAIYKRMHLGSDEVMKGARLVYRVDVYDGKVWNPAANVAYIIADEKGISSNRIQRTQRDGKISIEKSANGYPIIYFSEADVKIQPSIVKDGTYRIVELIEESDAEWGQLSGYVDALDDCYNGRIDCQDAVGFVNSNRKTVIEIAKEMENDSDQEFTFELRQVLRASQENITDIKQILETRKGVHLAYTVYDSETNEIIAKRTTQATGEITIKAKQFARIEVCDDTVWTVSEKQNTPYVVKEVSGTKDKTSKLSENTMLLQAKAPVILAQLSIEAKKKFFLKEELLDKDDFIVRAMYSDGSIKTLAKDEYVIDKDQVPTSATFDLTFAYGGLKETKTLQTAGTVILTSEMVDNGVIDAVTEEKVILNQGDVVIPEVILVNDKPCIVVSIGGNAFNAKHEVKSVVMPDSVTSIGNAAFYDCWLSDIKLSNNLKEIMPQTFWRAEYMLHITIPESVTAIRYSAFQSCLRLESVELPDNLQILEQSAFRGCTALKGTLVIPKNITVINDYLFTNCIHLEGVVLPDGLTEIGSQAFAECNSLVKINLPDSMQKIGFATFNKCTSLTHITLPAKLKEIPANGFGWCLALESITLAEGLEVIGTDAFVQCTKLKSIEIPSTVTSISNAFRFTGITSFFIKGKSKDQIAGAPWGLNAMQALNIVWELDQ